MKTSKYLLLGLLIICCTGCENFLDRSPISNANENEFYKSKADFQTALTSAYNTLYTLYAPESLPSFFGELSSDNAYNDNQSGTVRDYYAFDTHQNMDPNNSLVLKFWNAYYESIYKINNILAKSEGNDFEGRAALQGEARFLRALYYFDMVRAWGDIPLVLKPLDVKEALAQPRTPSDKVYESIIEDLKFAAENLPDKGNARFTGAATSDAANTLLGKVYLTVEDKAKAKDVLMKEYGKFQLVPYADLWDKTKKNGKESIFEIQYKGGTSNSPSFYWAMFSPLDNRIVTSRGGGFNQVTDNLWNAYETGDPRRDLSIQNGYKKANGESVHVKFFIKWMDKEAEVDKNLRENADNNFIILRYADVLLMLTEATGDVQYLNEVRDRVGLPHYGAAGYPSEYNTVALACEHESQVEFAGEFHRWFDLIRHGRAIDVLKENKNVTITNDQLLLPIPLEVIDQNPEIITQNKAYQ